MKKLLSCLLLFIPSASQILYGQPIEETTQAISVVNNSILKTNDTPPYYLQQFSGQVGRLGTGVVHAHTGIQDNYFIMPAEPPQIPDGIEVTNVYVQSNITFSTTGDSLLVYGGLSAYSDFQQAWNSYSTMILIGSVKSSGQGELQLTGSGLDQMKYWLQLRNPRSKIYFTLKNGKESAQYATISSFGLRVQYRYKYNFQVSVNDQFDQSIGNVNGSQISARVVTFVLYRNQAVSVSLNATASKGSQQYAYTQSVLNGSGYSNTTFTQLTYQFSLTSSTTAAITYVPGVQITLDNQAQFLTGSTGRIVGSTLNASQGGQDKGTVIAGNSLLLPQNVNTAYKTLYGNNGEDLAYQAIYKIKHRDWNTTLSKAKLTLDTVTSNPATHTAWYHELKAATASVTQDGVTQSSQTAQIKDPWRVVNGTQPGSWDTYTSGSSLGVGNDGSTIAGMLQNVGYVDDGNAHYRIKVDAVQTINGSYSAFANWTGSSIIVPSTTASESPVTFTAAGASVTANYKGNLRTGAPSLADTKNQRRLLHQSSIYESMGDIWLTATRDGGATWWVEERLNSLLGAASNPSFSNIISYNGQTFGVVTWVEQNGGNYELHLQSFRVYAGAGYTPHPVWYGWTGVGDRSSSNHRILSQMGYGVYARSGARPVLNIGLYGSDLFLETAFERSSSGICNIKWYYYGFTGGTLELANYSSDPFSPWTISSNVSDVSAVFIYYPSAYGQPAKNFIYFLGAGYDAGLRVVEHDIATGQKRVLSKGYTESTYSSLQGAVNSTSASFVVVAQGNAYNGNVVNVYTKPTYYSQSTLNTTYLNMYQPTVMVENVGNFGSPVWYGFIRSYGDGGWYHVSSSQGPSFVGYNTAGIFTREQIPAGDKVSIAVTTTTNPARLNVYNGSGSLPKTDAISFAVKTRAVRFSKQLDGKERMLLLDFSDASVIFPDSLQNNKDICVAQIDRFSSDGVILSQEDSLAAELGVDIVRDGRTLSSYTPARWRALSERNFPELRTRDLLRLRQRETGRDVWGYREISITRAGLQKTDSTVSKQLVSTTLSRIDQRVSVFPNPFNPSTTFRLSLPTLQRVRLSVYNLLGQEVAQLIDGELEAGDHNLRFDAGNLSSGIYLYRVIIDDKITSGILLLMK